MEGNKVVFRQTVRPVGGSLVVAIPPEICEYLKIEGGTEICWIPDESKHGLFTGLWNPKQQKK
jgi:hypothetical protein